MWASARRYSVLTTLLNRRKELSSGGRRIHKISRNGSSNMTKVLAFANQKGGVAKTTSTLNTGVALREMHKRVLVIDMDPQGNLSMCQGINPDNLTKSMFDVLVHRMPIEEVVQRREVDIAPASIDLAGAELALSSTIGRERSLEKALMSVKNDYDFVLIDTPPQLGLLTINALTAADGVIVPVQCEYLSLRGLAQLERTLEMIRENLNPDVRIEGILPTMYDARTIHGREAVEILKDSFGERVFNTVVRKTIKFAEAPVKGCSIMAYEPEGAAADTYRNLAKELLHGESSEHERRGSFESVPAYGTHIG
jgi:chromosome partitioning protein